MVLAGCCSARGGLEEPLRTPLACLAAAPIAPAADGLMLAASVAAPPHATSLHLHLLQQLHMNPPMSASLKRSCLWAATRPNCSWSHLRTRLRDSLDLEGLGSFIRALQVPSCCCSRKKPAAMRFSSPITEVTEIYLRGLAPKVVPELLLPRQRPPAPSLRAAAVPPSCDLP